MTGSGTAGQRGATLRSVSAGAAKAAGARDLSSFNILYATGINGATMDESAQDATLRTYVDTRSGISARRIKHFSGYTSSGRECDGGPDCIQIP